MIIVFCYSCNETQKTALKTEKIKFKKEGILSIYKGASDSLIMKFDIEIAETPYETQTGLMYRESMAEKEGMFFIFPEVAMHRFYMKNTLIPLDIIFIDENLKIASFQENTIPLEERGLSSEVPILYVLEVNAGLSERLTLEVGDRIDYQRIAQ